ncbi:MULTISPECIES: hypothetical protein [Asaia]|uniref:Uncharacterized protein n=1 Tax=Asaia spathodeae TaxID=657016 RepID=A0ABX2PAD3_9PROT|nr:hypothetical protein [Asaia spathodeae]GBR20288.1 hypothetical protein AA105894_2523 [Asaia spathodeae NBRC 105894]
MAAVQSNEKGTHKVTQLRTPPRAGAETEDVPGDDTIIETDATPTVSKARLASPEPRRSRLRGRALSVSVVLLAGVALGGAALYGIRTVTQHGVTVPFVNDRAPALPSPTTTPRRAPAQFAFDSAPMPQPGPQATNMQGVTASAAQPAAPIGAEPTSQPASATVAGGQAALILELARQIGAVKTQNEKMAADLADAKKELATLVTDNAAGFGTVNGALGEIRHRVDRIDDSLRARAEPATTEPSEKPAQAAGAKNTAPAAASQPHPPSPAASATAAAAKTRPAVPLPARKAYRVTSGSPSVALIVGNDGQTRMVHPVGMAELPGDSSLPGWGAITELRQVGENWEVVTEHGVIR